MKKSICIFTGFSLPHLGGVERYTDKIVEELKKLDYDITIVTSNHNGSKSHEILENYEIYRLPIYNIFKDRYPILKKNKEYKSLLKEIDEKKFDYYICQTRFYLITQVGAKMAYMHGKRPIIIEHGSSHLSIGNSVLDFFGAKLEHFLTNKLKKCNPYFYGVSKKCTEWLKHFDIRASGVLYNSVPRAAYDIYKNAVYDKNIASDTIVITYIGRIIKEKGVELLLEAFSEIKNEYNACLYIAGDGPLLEAYKKNYRDEKIHFEGKIDYEQVMSLLNQSDIFVHPSMYPEGLPTGILEAGLMKNAVIATDRGGTKEVINKEKYGIIIEENKESLLIGLESLLKNQYEIDVYKENLQERILEEFTWEITAKKLSDEIAKNNM